jgi:hypothetical protein
MHNASDYFRARRTDWSAFDFESPDIDGWRPYYGTHVFIERKSIPAGVDWAHQDFDLMHFYGLRDLVDELAAALGLLVVYERTAAVEVCPTCNIDQAFDTFDAATPALWVASVADITDDMRSVARDHRGKQVVRVVQRAFHKVGGSQFGNMLAAYKCASEVRGGYAVDAFNRVCFECELRVACMVHDVDAASR